MNIDENEELQQEEPGAPPATEAPAAPQPSLFDNDKPPPGPVDVDLADGGEVAPVEAEPEKKPEKPQRQRSPNRQEAGQRINQIRAQLGEAERALAEERAARLATEQQNRELAARSRHVDAAAFDAHATMWRNEEAAAEQELAIANEKMLAGDLAAPKLVAAATRRLTKAASEMQAVNGYTAQFPDQFNPDGSRRQGQPQPRQQEQERPVQQRQPAPTPAAAPLAELQQWVADNPWIDARSQEHDPEMAKAATEFSALLDNRYNREGRSGEIGRDGYLQELNGMLERQFPEAYQEQPAPPPTRRPTMTRPNGAGVAPASRQSPTSQPGQPGSNSVRMSAEEHDFALKMTRNGAYKYPVGHPRAGQRMDDKDGVRYHAQYVQKDRDMEPMRGKR